MPWVRLRSGARDPGGYLLVVRGGSLGDCFRGGGFVLCLYKLLIGTGILGGGFHGRWFGNGRLG